MCNQNATDMFHVSHSSDLLAVYAMGLSSGASSSSCCGMSSRAFSQATIRHPTGCEKCPKMGVRVLRGKPGGPLKKNRKHWNQTTRQWIEHALACLRHGGGYIYIYIIFGRGSAPAPLGGPGGPRRPSGAPEIRLFYQGGCSPIDLHGDNIFL